MMHSIVLAFGLFACVVGFYSLLRLVTGLRRPAPHGDWDDIMAPWCECGYLESCRYPDCHTGYREAGRL